MALRVLVACEFTGTVRDAFLAAGHDALSCDLIPSERPGPHHVGDVRALLGGGWDVLIAHPPCTYLAASGARWWAGRVAEQAAALDFVRALWAAPIARVAIENPAGALTRLWRPPDQYVQPWQFGHSETKKTGLWLRGLPPLFTTEIAALPWAARVHRLSPSPDRGRERSRFYAGIAAAMARQWGGE